MNRESLEILVNNYKMINSSSEELNKIRTNIFDSYDAGEIQERTKIRLLKKLYTIASSKNVFFVSIMDRKPGLPKNDEEEEEMRKEEESYEESYEESFSYEEEKDEDDEA